MISKKQPAQEKSAITLGRLMFLIPALGILIILASDYWRIRSEIWSLHQEVNSIRKQIEAIQKVK
jgi:hypothetical protein